MEHRFGAFGIAPPTPTHVPMSPLDKERCVGEATRIIRNSLEVSGRFRGFWRVLEGCYQKVPEEWVSGI